MPGYKVLQKPTKHISFLKLLRICLTYCFLDFYFILSQIEAKQKLPNSPPRLRDQKFSPKISFINILWLMLAVVLFVNICELLLIFKLQMLLRPLKAGNTTLNCPQKYSDLFVEFWYKCVARKQMCRQEYQSLS